MMNISASSRTSCFDSTYEYLDSLRETHGGRYRFLIWELKMGISVLETFALFTRKCSRKRSYQGDAMSDSISFRIQNLVGNSIREVSSAIDPHASRCEVGFTIGPYTSRCTPIGGLDLCLPDIIHLKDELRDFFEREIKKLDIISLLGDVQLVLDFIDSISMNLKRLLEENCIFDASLGAIMLTLQEKLMFLKCFIRLARVQDVESQLLDHVKVVAVKAARLISTSWFQRESMEVYNEIELKIAKLIHKMIDPVNPQVRNIYTHVLEAFMLSRSSCTLTSKENRQLWAEFIGYLLQYIKGIMSECYNCYLIRVKDQMLKLLEGVNFLCILLNLPQEKFDELNNWLKEYHIRVVVSEAGILTFSFFGNEMKEGLCRDTDLALSNLLEVLKFINDEAVHLYRLTSPSSSFSFPKTNELGSLDFLVETLKEPVSSKADSVAFPNNQIHTIRDDLVFLRSFLGTIVEQRNRDEKLQALWSCVMKVAYSAELEIDCALLGDKHELCLDAIAKDIHLMKIEAEKIYDSIRYGGETQGVSKTTVNMPSQVTAPMYNEAMVGLNDEVESVIDKLVSGSRLLDIIAIVGMPGLGKTTLANEVYGDPSVKLHFHKRAWCCVSQTYSKYSLLVQILCCIDYECSVQYFKMNEDDMAHKLYKLLKGYKYLIVLDDVWDIDGWDMLKHSLPNDCNGSRVLLTSRFQKLSLQIKPENEPHRLRPLTYNESCELLQKKLFAKGDCPPTLNEVVLHVAKYCRGLPLTVVLIAGILASTERDCWEEVVRHISSSIYVDNEHCMKTVEQSYNCLPNYLKPCLLYFSAFKEDQEIPVRKMLWLWISEGFVQKIEGKSLEDVADGYLMDLIGRSLIMATQQRSLGGVKACRIHDLVHEFCIAKGKEESFLHSLHEDNFLTFTGPFYPHRLSIHHTTNMGLKKSMQFFPNLHCLLLSSHGYGQLDNKFKFLLPKLLRVLDSTHSCLTISGKFPRQVTFLVHLRHLRIGCFVKNIPSTIANLSRLETFMASPVGSGRFLPNTIWKIKTLRHLIAEYAKAAGDAFIFPIDNLEGSPDLKHLDTLTLAIDPTSQNLQKILSKLPSLRRLTIVLERHSTFEFAGNHDRILLLNCLSRLESLKICQFDGFEFEFPLNLKKLTLTGHRQPWRKISAIGKLTNLEVLKLYHDRSLGERWEMEEGEFPNLQFLKLSSSNIRCWTASFGMFSCLKKLVLDDCWQLEDVPSCLVESLTLEMIEVKCCSESLVNSVKQIHQEQKDLGNQDLKVVIIKKS